MSKRKTILTNKSKQTKKIRIEEQTCLLDHCPDEIVLTILQFLPEIDRIRSARTCKRFLVLSRDEHYFKTQAEQYTRDNINDFYKVTGSYYKVVMSCRYGQCNHCYSSKGYFFGIIHKYFQLCDECEELPDYENLTKTNAKSTFLLNDKDLESLPHECGRSRGISYLVPDLLKAAQEKYGGQENFEEALERSKTRKEKLRRTRENKEKEEKERIEKLKQERANVILEAIKSRGLDLESHELVDCWDYSEYIRTGERDVVKVLKQCLRERIRKRKRFGYHYLVEQCPGYWKKAMDSNYFKEYMETGNQKDLEDSALMIREKRKLDHKYSDTDKIIAEKIDRKLIQKRRFWPVVNRTSFINESRKFTTWKEFVARATLILLKWKGKKVLNWPSKQKTIFADKWFDEEGIHLAQDSKIHWPEIHKRFTAAWNKEQQS